MLLVFHVDIRNVQVISLYGWCVRRYIVPSEAPIHEIIRKRKVDKLRRREGNPFHVELWELLIFILDVPCVRQEVHCTLGSTHP